MVEAVLLLALGAAAYHFIWRKGYMMGLGHKALEQQAFQTGMDRAVELLQEGADVAEAQLTADEPGDLPGELLH